MPAHKTDPIKRLFDRIDRRGDTECWPWRGSVNNCGYGLFYLDGKRVSAHRAVMVLLKREHLVSGKTQKGPMKRGPVGARREVRHLCNNRICCNPVHLVYDNHSANMKHVVASGHFRSPTQKLTPADYVAIRASTEPTTVLMERFGASRNHLNSIRRR